MPSKESIREIRINQNPFAPEYDKLGFGRIEIFTKPGTDKFKGFDLFQFANQFWNTRNPYALKKATFLLKEYGGSVSGALSKRASFFLDVRRDEVDNGSIINAITLDPHTLAIINPFADVFRTRQRRFGINPRVDYQLNSKNTLTVRYGFTRADIQGAGIGGFNLVSRGTHPENTNHTLQVTETAVLGKNIINETRFQFFRTYGPNVANDLSPAIQVLGSFNVLTTGSMVWSPSNYLKAHKICLFESTHPLRTDCFRTRFISLYEMLFPFRISSRVSPEIVFSTYPARLQSMSSSLISNASDSRSANRR